MPGKIVSAVVAVLLFFTFILWSFTGKNDSLLPVIRLYLTLFIFIGVAYWIMRSFKLGGTQPASQLRVTEKLVLENGASVYVVEDESRQWLVGVGNKAITVLDKIYKHSESFETILADVEHA